MCLPAIGRLFLSRLTGDVGNGPTQPEADDLECLAGIRQRGEGWVIKVHAA